LPPTPPMGDDAADPYFFGRPNNVSSCKYINEINI